MSTLEEADGQDPEETETPAENEAAEAAGSEASAASDEVSASDEPAGGVSTSEAPEENAVERGDEGSTLERGGEEEDPLDAAEIAVDPARVRRAPRFGRFVLVGIVLGLAVALVQTLVAAPDTIEQAGGPWASNSWGFFGLMAAIFVPIAVLLMCGIALLVERRSHRTR